MTTDDTALAARLTISEIVRVYRNAEAQIRGAFAQLADVEETLTRTFATSDTRSISIQGSRGSLSFGDPERELVRVRHEIWSALVDRLEIRRMMSVARWTELQRQIERHELPDISEENVAALVEGFRAHLPEMLTEAVAEVFEWLRPHATRYKRNSQLEVPRRIALTGIVENWSFGHGSPFRVRHHREPQLTALEQVFSALDGRGQITKTHYSAISNAIKAPEFRGHAKTEYFEFRVYKNGALHLTFLREDLLARFNQIAGGARLRPATTEAA